MSGSSFFRSSIRLREPSNSPSSIASYDNALNLPWEMAYICYIADTHLNCATDGLSHVKKKKKNIRKNIRKNTGTRVEKWKFPAPLPNNCADEIAFRSYGLTWFKLRMCAPASLLYTLPLTASKRENKIERKYNKGRTYHEERENRASLNAFNFIARVICSSVVVVLADVIQ